MKRFLFFGAIALLLILGVFFLRGCSSGDSPATDREREMRAEKDKYTAQYKDKIAALRTLPEGSERNRLIEELAKLAEDDKFNREDAVYILLERHKLGMARGKFNLDDISLIRRHSNRTASIAFLTECINTLKTKDYDFGTYSYYRDPHDFRSCEIEVNTTEAKEAVIEDLESQIRQLDGSDTGRKEESAMSLKEILQRMKKALSSTLADQAWERKNYKLAEKIYNYFGDRESAAGACWGQNVGKIQSDGKLLRPVDEIVHGLDVVIEKYPETQKADDAAYQKIFIFAMEGDIEKTKQALEAYTAKYPDHRFQQNIGRMGLGFAFNAKKLYDESIKQFEAIIADERKHDSLDIDHVQYLCTMYMKCINNDKAKEFIAELITALERGEIKTGTTKLDIVKACQQLADIKKLVDQGQFPQNALGILCLRSDSMLPML